MAQWSNNQNNQIRALGSETIVIWTDDGRQSHTMNSADIVKQS